MIGLSLEMPKNYFSTNVENLFLTCLGRRSMIQSINATHRRDEMENFNNGDKVVMTGTNIINHYKYINVPAIVDFQCKATDMMVYILVKAGNERRERSFAVHPDQLKRI